MRVRVLGAGIIGLTCARELIERGHDVEVVDPAPGSGASHAAAGMLSPAGELWYGEGELLRLGSASVAMWPALAAALGVPLHRTGTLLVAADRADLDELDRHLALLSASGACVGSLRPRELLVMEPGLGRVAGGAYLPDDHSVDPRAILAALRARIPVVPAARGRTDVTVLATGFQLPEPFSGLVHGVRGEAVRVRALDRPRHVVRGVVHGRAVYLVPRADSDEVMIGATCEERDGVLTATVEGVHRLLDAARRLYPGLDAAAFTEAIARERPGSRDNLPLVGPSGTPGVLLAAGHFRHGVMLAPLTAALVADHLEHGRIEACLDPRRFVAAEAAAWT